MTSEVLLINRPAQEVHGLIRRYRQEKDVHSMICEVGGRDGFRGRLFINRVNIVINLDKEEEIFNKCLAR
jgi:hypothetical protein